MRTPWLAVARAGFDERSHLEQQFLRLIQEADDALVGDTVMDEPPVTLPRHQTALGQAVQVH